jgi:Plasmid replication region DNA-binding N-term
VITSTAPAKPYGTSAGGIRQSDVSHAADTLLRLGVRPTVEKVRNKLGRGSPNTINPMLDAWWKTLSARLDSGPAALHRLPESIAHIAEALWMQALEEGKRRALIEQRDSARVAELDKQRIELRSHVLTLREGELDSRLRDRDRTIEDLKLQQRELTGLLRKEQASRELLTTKLAQLPDSLKRQQPVRRPKKATKSPKAKSTERASSKRTKKKTRR